MRLRTGSSFDPTRTVLAPIGGAGIGSVGRTSASCPRQRRVDFATQHLAAGERAHVVLGEDVARHFQPQTHRRRVALGHRLERRRVIRRRVAQHDVQIDRRDAVGMGDVDSSIRAPAAPQRLERRLEPRPHLVVEQVAEVPARDGEAQAADGRWRSAAGASGAPSKRVVHVPRVGHGARRADRRDRACATAARRRSVESRRSVGFSPTMPQAAAGIRIDPPVSVPSVASAMPAATLAAEPPLDPPGERVGSCGLRAGPNAESSFVVPNANSCRLVLPMKTAPAWRRCGDRRRVARRDVPFAHARGGGRRRAADVEQILDRDRDAVKRPAIASGGSSRSASLRLTPGLVGHDEDERVQPRVVGLDPRADTPRSSRTALISRARSLRPNSAMVIIARVVGGESPVRRAMSSTADAARRR